jgi:hypothetical protein
MFDEKGWRRAGAAVVTGIGEWLGCVSPNQILLITVSLKVLALMW